MLFFTMAARSGREEILLQMFSGKVAPSGTMTFPVKYEDTHSKLDWNSC
jgi:hypothetical protein